MRTDPDKRRAKLLPFLDGAREADRADAHAAAKVEGAQFVEAFEKFSGSEDEDCILKMNLSAYQIFCETWHKGRTEDDNGEVFKTLHRDQDGKYDNCDKRIGVPAPIQKHKTRSGRTVRSSVTKANNITAEQFTARRAQLKRKRGEAGDASESPSEPEEVVTHADSRSSCTGATARPRPKMRCPSDGARSAGSQNKQDDGDVATTSSRTSRTSGKGVGTRSTESAPKTTRTHTVVGPTTLEPSRKVLEGYFKKDPETFETMEFINAKAALMDCIVELNTTLGNNTKGMIGDLTTLEKVLTKRGGFSDDLNHSSKDWLVTMTGVVLKLHKFLADLKPAKAAALLDIKNDYEEKYSSLATIFSAYGQHTQALRERGGDALKDQKSSYAVDYWKPRKVYEHLTNGGHEFNFAKAIAVPIASFYYRDKNSDETFETGSYMINPSPAEFETSMACKWSGNCGVNTFRGFLHSQRGAFDRKRGSPTPTLQIQTRCLMGKVAPGAF